MLLKRIINFFTSLKLTVVLLSFGILLVFIGTVAQADEGLYNAQARYFKQWIVLGITMFGKRVPVALPGGYLIGTLLLVNLVAAHIKRFQFTPKKIGIQLTHAGVILLLVGQLTTDLFSHETQIRFAEGETKVYAESAMDYELAIVTDASPNTEEVVAIPDRLLAKGGDLKHEKLPFTLRVKSYWPNSEPSFRAPMMQNAPPVTTNGLAQSFDFRSVAEIKSMDAKNVPTAILEVAGPNSSPGTWVVSGWAGDQIMVEALAQSFLRQKMGKQMVRSIISRLTAPQEVEAGGKKYSLALRPARVYQPYSLTLLKATHSIYRGTDIPKDFRSRVRLENARTGENREVEIFMNSPLRYAGQTYFQYQMAAGEMVQRAGETPSSTLQVVRNPAWITPYAGCIIVATGLVVQFMFHLVAFVSKTKKKA